MDGEGKDEQQFEEYVREHRRALLGLAGLLTADLDAAQDVVQDVLAAALPRWHRIGPLANPHAYVRRMLINRVISEHRRWGRIEPRPAEDLDQAVVDDTDRIERREALIRAVARLPLQQRTAVVLRYFLDLPDEEIAAALHCRPSTVRAHLHRALKALRVETVTSALAALH